MLLVKKRLSSIKTNVNRFRSLFFDTTQVAPIPGRGYQEIPGGNPCAETKIS
jgi:hypothetical protein